MGKEDFISSYWESQGVKYQISSKASWEDTFMVNLERLFLDRTIKELKPKNVLDCGTSNGHSLIELAKNNSDINFSCFDLSPSMVEGCNEAISNSNLKNIRSAFVADIRDINDPYNNKYDLIMTTRVLINLPTWEDQIKALNKMLDLIVPDGRLLILEAFWEPLCKINALRLIGGLEPLKEHDFNKYLKIHNLKKFLDEKGLIYKKTDFSSTYYLMTRFIRETIGANQIDKSYNSDFNKNALLLENNFTRVSDFGIQQAFEIYK